MPKRCCLAPNGSSLIADNPAEAFLITALKTIHNIIKIGGLWINFGPLLYHYTENESEVSIELSWEEVKHIILGFGFEFKKIEKVKTTYSSNKESMTQRIYNCIYFTAVKMK